MTSALFLYLLALATLNFLVLAQPEEQSPLFQVYQFAESESLQQCRNNLETADQDGDLRLTRVQYASFLGLQSGNEAYSDIRNIPFRLEAVYLLAACWCEIVNSNDNQCCLGGKDHIPLDTAQSEIIDPYLDFLCVNVQSALQEIDPTESPSVLPTLAPSLNPTQIPSIAPTQGPSIVPTTSPSAIPTPTPTATPTSQPSQSPSKEPSSFPRNMPSAAPTLTPSASPSQRPSDSPSSTPSQLPSDSPSSTPSQLPSDSPTSTPSQLPSDSPTSTPSQLPSDSPTSTPSQLPSVSPTLTPSQRPSIIPTEIQEDLVFPEPSAAPTVPLPSLCVNFQCKRGKELFVSYCLVVSMFLN